MRSQRALRGGFICCVNQSEFDHMFSAFLPSAPRAIAAALCLITVLAAAQPAAARELASMHDQRVENGQICMSSHEHIAFAGPYDSKRTAYVRAVKKWQDYTVDEYGHAWGSFRRSAGKDVTCTIKRGKWGCKLRSRPCRRK